MMLTLLLALFALFIYHTIFKPMGHWKKYKIPHAKPLPFVGNMWSFVSRKQHFVHWLIDICNYHKDARYFGFYSFRQPVLMIKDVNLIKQIAIKDFDHFVDHRQLIFEETDPLYGKNLINLQGDKWRQMRSTISPAFTGNKMRAMFILITESINKSMYYFKKAMIPDEPLIVELKDVFTRVSNDVLASVVFGIKCDSLMDEENEFYLMSKDISSFEGLKAFKLFISSISISLVKFIRLKLVSYKVANFFRNIVVDNIRMREKENIIRPDMIHLLMEARKGNLKHTEIHTSAEDSAGFATVQESKDRKHSIRDKLDLPDDDIAAQTIAFIFGSFDTISTSLCHTGYELAINEDVQRKLQKEIDEAWEECDGKLTYDVIMKMKYMDMVISESLRKWPSVVIIDRICTKDYIIEPTQAGEEALHLKNGDFIWFPIISLHRDPKYYPNPEKFDPERFSDENKRNIIPYSYLPFGVGPRNCIASRFALLKIKTIFFYFLSKYNFELCQKSQVPLQLTKSCFTMVAEHGYWLGMKLRNDKSL